MYEVKSTKQFIPYNFNITPGNSYIHGTEYIANGLPDILSSYDNYNDMPCSVCETSGKGQVLMIPAKNTCPGMNIHHECDPIKML